jgi:uncharacterized protein (DUF1810 family)
MRNFKRGTKAMRKKDLFKRISPDGLFNSTTIFESLTADQREKVKRMYALWFDSWVREDAEEFLLEKKQQP